jgi:hypothetical protein
METTMPFVTVPCRVCYAKTLRFDDRRVPDRCGRCGAPYDAATQTFRSAADSAGDAAPLRRVHITIKG